MKYIVNVSITDLRREPKPRPADLEGSDPLQESQLLFGECLLSEQVPYNGWLFVEAIEQPKCLSNGKWMGYPGWVPFEHLLEVKEFPDYDLTVTSHWALLVGKKNIELSFGSRLKSVRELEHFWEVELPDKTLAHVLKSDVQKRESLSDFRKGIIALGKTMIGFPYHWGGRSAYRPDLEVRTSIDCSGLTHLLYRAQGIEIPRDAHDQYLQCVPCTKEELEPGDLVFCAQKKTGTQRITHVMIYSGEGRLLEATSDSQSVREISLEERLQTLMDKTIYYGRLKKNDAIS